VSIFRDFEISQFWQNLQVKLQPGLLLDRIDCETTGATVGREHDSVVFAGADKA
jgi:hypothetical protein